MGWTERQRALLQAMGLRQWSPADSDEPAEPAEPGVTDQAAAPQALQVRPPDTPKAPGARAPEPIGPRTAQAPAAVAPAVRPVVRPSPALSVDDAARAAHIATLDWPALREAAAACGACGLCEGRQQAVFGVGHPQAHWMVVGEAPGEQEDLKGEPFVGPSGELLDAMLRALRLTRADGGEAAPAQRVYIANTVKCRPPRNRNPTPEELLRCEPFLVRQIQLVQPRIILAMGRFAVQSLLSSTEPIGRLRGRVHHYQGVPLVVTYHPAYLLRNLTDKARAWEDLCLAAQVAEQAG
jgi:uracil-DNA glycosylase